MMVLENLGNSIFYPLKGNPRGLEFSASLRCSRHAQMLRSGSSPCNFLHPLRTRSSCGLGIGGFGV